MFLKLKALSAVILLLCLFAPLSQCQYQESPSLSKMDINELELRVAHVYPLNPELDRSFEWRKILPALLFSLPFLTLLLQLLRLDLNRKIALKNQQELVNGRSWFVLVFDSLVALALLALLLTLFNWVTVLPAFYVAFLSACLYLLSSWADYFAT